jgi:CheY-like chemotaxis protein
MGHHSRTCLREVYRIGVMFGLTTVMVSMRSTALILDDSKTQSAIIAKMIEAQGWIVARSDHVSGALEILRSQRIDALFLDIFVGSRNTLVDFHRFRVLAGNSAIILMTAGSKQEGVDATLQKARTVGADYVLHKPFPKQVIKGILSNLSKFDNTRPKHLLVIDDSVTVCLFIAKHLEGLGYRISIAQTMEYAFSNVDIAHVDLVLCDIFMPGMGSLRGMRQIRATWPNVKVISMSAGVSERVSGIDALNLSRDIGIDAQIVKPFSAQDLASVISLVLDLPSQSATDFAEIKGTFVVD